MGRERKRMFTDKGRAVPTSWRAEYWSTDTPPLLGGVRRAQSYLFAERADAEAFLEQCLRVNREAGRPGAGKVTPHVSEPDLRRCCGEIVAAVGVCPRCEK